jgi:AcrR family transcriptional regulator
LGKSAYSQMMARDREETKTKILQAVGQVLATSGFQGLGINAIARVAGVDKVLIYRYFKDVPTLLKTFAQSGE